MRQLFTVLSGLTIAISYIPFIRGTIQGWVVPNRASWMVWFVQDVLIASSAIMARVGPAAVMPVIWGLGAAMMLILSLTKGTGDTEGAHACHESQTRRASRGPQEDAHSAENQASLLKTSKPAGGVPTVVKAWAKPWTETMSGWLLMILGTVFSSLAIERWTFDSGFLPVVVGLFQLSVALPLVLYRLNRSVATEEAKR